MVDFKTYYELLSLYSDYAMVCDSTEWEKWPDFFVDDGTYRLQPRENFDQGLPLCLLALESKNMIRDRVYGVKETLYHDPYYQRHIVGTPRVLSVEQGADGERIRSRRQYHLAKFPHQSAEEVCRQACPEAFAGDGTQAGGQ